MYYRATEELRSRLYNNISHPLFFLTKRYWCSTKNTAIEEIIHEEKPNLSMEKEEFKQDTADIERTKVIQQERDGSICDGIRVLGINKIFKSGLCKPKILHALKDIYLEIASGELVALLGHNGAGKSTLINILTGILGWNSGTAKVYGMNLAENINEIQHIIGLVPQFDILWNELTAAEHLRLFAQLKGIPNDKIPELIKNKLNEVKLVKQENSLIKTFSGGMKRRLSVALGSIGNPKIIIMDEPTTGMDPVNKHSVWKLIKVTF